MLFETMNQGVVFQNADGSIVDVNKSAERILGLSSDQLKGLKSTDPRWKSVREDGSELPGSEHPSMRALADGKILRGEIMGIDNPEKKGMTWIKVDAIPIFKENQKKPYQVYTVFDEININDYREIK